MKQGLHIYVYIYIYVCVYIYTYTCVYIYIHICMYIVPLCSYSCWSVVLIYLESLRRSQSCQGRA